MKKHCILILVSYEFEALQLTFKALDHTVDPNVPIIIILNGAVGSYKDSKVEQYSRIWASAGINRHVIRPVKSGKAPIYALQETVEESPLLKDIDYILKIDDDLIPLKKGWDTELANCYFEKEKTLGRLGFVTGLINNNVWGFKELLTIYGKWEEYVRFMQHPSKAGLDGRRVNYGEVDDGRDGTIFQYPALAAWLHEWTSFDPESFVEKTKGLPVKEIDLNTHYSIGCTFSHKQLWKDITVSKITDFDELMIHQYCQANKLRKFAVMSQPLLHLYYNTQRIANAHLMPGFVNHLADYFHDESIRSLQLSTMQDQLNDIEDKLKLLKSLDRRLSFLEGKIEKVKTFLKPFRPFIRS